MSHPENDLVSVVIPTRNRRARLARAIESALAQTWRNIEIVVVDDASTDDTSVYLAGLTADDSRIKVVRNEQPLGGGGARNLGVAAAGGIYIAFLDDDDIWLPEKLAMQLSLLRQNARASAVSCGFVAEFPIFGKRPVHVRPPQDAQQLLRSNHLGGASMCLTTKAALEAIGGFDPALRSGQDWDLWIKLFDRGEIAVSDQALVRYVPHNEARITSNPRSAYTGRRKIYFRYRARMNEATRRFLFCELLYCRKVLLIEGGLTKLPGFFKVLGAALGQNALRYTFRFAKHLALG